MSEQTILGSEIFKLVKKRDGRLVAFDQSQITRAVLKAMTVTGEGGLEDASRVSDRAMKELKRKYLPGYILGIEEIQDVVETALIMLDYAKTAKSYILYRHKRAEVREKTKEIPEKIKELVSESKKYFRNSLGEFIYYRSYSRWLESENRRETWVETVDRYLAFMKENIGDSLTDEEFKELREAILKQDVMPSMRLMWSAGEAARKSNVSAYNCSFIAPSKIQDFAEIMYLAMCGAGVGFSAEHQTVQMLPQIKRQTGEVLPTFIVEDSKEGWADALTAGLKAWFEGKDISFDFSKLRPAGARLKTMGGKSSGPKPLIELLEFSRRKIMARQGRRLNPIDVHDIVCKIGEIVVMGGVRRSALISLSDIDDTEMRLAKSGQFYLTEPQRSLANNSVAYNEKPTASQFLDEWLSLSKSGTGERGIFNRGGLKFQVPERRWKTLKKDAATTGTNPCGEIILKSKQFCNLTEVVARAEDTEETLINKTRLATILGTYQSTLTNFPYLSEDWKKNCEEERLLGVSVTGQWDSPASREKNILSKMREKAVETNKIYAQKFGINHSSAITCVKPSGTVSQLVDAASGMHPRYSKYYIRRIRIAASDALFQMLKEQKISYHPEVGQSVESASTYVLEFPVKAPDVAVFRNDLTAVDQLDHWKRVKENYTEHNPSVTISIGGDEWIKVANWVYENWNIIGGLAFLPREEKDHVYALAPYEEISEEKYNALVATFPEIDFSQIMVYEKEDETQGSKELACVAAVCEIN
ncbi:ribonucleoside-triphosphate reductase [Candidatus Wolfebacteria bacterium]|nr:ribonucleoside-triphosphate reductase [Candidatus Wolfebacteria bacterium]